MARKLKSGIVGQAQVIFGGAIRMELGWVKSARGEELAIGMAELKHPAAKAGDPIIDEETYNGIQVTLVFPGFEPLNNFRHILDLLEAELKKRIAERDAQQKIDFDDADPSHLVHEHIDPPTFEEAQGEQKPAGWSERDESIRKCLLSHFSRYREDEVFLSNILMKDIVSWLEKRGEQKTVVVIPKFRVGDVIRPKGSKAEYTIESISGECYHGKGWGLCIGYDNDYELVKQRTAWSEEDEKTLNEIFSVAARASLRKSPLFGKSYDYIKWQNWLKSLRGRVGCEANCTTMWKPSDGQMAALMSVASGFEVTEKTKEPLKELFVELKKLREE